MCCIHVPNWKSIHCVKNWYFSSLYKPSISGHDELFKDFVFKINLCFSVIAFKGKAFTEPCLGLNNLWFQSSPSSSLNISKALCQFIQYGKCFNQCHISKDLKKTYMGHMTTHLPEPWDIQMQALSKVVTSFRYLIFLRQRKFQRFQTLIKSALRYLEKGNCRHGGLMVLKSLVKLLQMKRYRMPSKKYWLLELKILISPLSGGDSWNYTW